MDSKAGKALAWVAAALLLAGAALLVWTQRLPEALPVEIAPKPAAKRARAMETVPPEPTEGRVNVNKATLEELCTVKGIGPSTAQSILEEREKNGFFTHWEDLLSVKGIGPKTLKKLRPQLCLNDTEDGE